MERRPVRRAASNLYDMTRAIPAPAMAVSTAASDVFTVSLVRMGAAISMPPLINSNFAAPLSRPPQCSHGLKDHQATPDVREQQGILDFAHATTRMDPMRVAIMLLSGSGSIRMATSILFSTGFKTRSLSRRRKAISGYTLRNSQESGSKWRCPEAPRRGDCEVTRGRAVLARSLLFGVVDLFNDAFARLDIRLTGVGKRQVARRPLKQLSFQTRFELGEPAANRRDRYAELSRSRR